MRSSRLLALAATFSAAACAVACGGEVEPPQPPPPPPPRPIQAPPPPPLVTAAPPPPSPPAPPLSQLELASLKAAAEALNQHDARKYASLFTWGAVHKEAAAPDVVGRDGIGDRMQLLLTSFPDFRFSFDTVWQRGNVVAVTWRWTGTDTGGFLGKKPTGRKAGVQGASVAFFNDDGLVREIHVYEDGDTLVGQLDAKAGAASVRPPPADSTAAMEVITAGPGDAGLDVAGSFYQALEDDKDAQVLALLREDATADDFRMSPRTARGPGEWKALLKSWRGALGSFKELPLMNQLVVGDYVISERVANGAQRGREVSVHSVDIAQMKDGKIARYWTWSNGLELDAQARVQDKGRGKRP